MLLVRFMFVRCLFCCTSLLLNSASCPLPAFCSSLQGTKQQPALGKHPPQRGLPKSGVLLVRVCSLARAPSRYAEWRVRVVLPPLMPRLTGRSAACALHVRALLVLLHLIASELCVLSAACLFFVATGTTTTTSSREASPPALAP